MKTTTGMYRDPDWLRQKYIVENMSINQIAALCGVRYETVRKHLLKFRIPRRPKGNPFERGNAFKGGRRIKPEGYIGRWNGQGYDYEHRIAAETKLGRPLRPTEIVHHINGDKTDNRPENLLVLTHSEHAALHAQQRRRVKCPSKA